MINPNDVLPWFQYAIDNDFGYIWGTCWIVWTAAKQAAATREMTVKYGKKWIGHTVCDCANLLRGAFMKAGYDGIHAGSNLIWECDLSAKGQLVNGSRSDGMVLQPCTAVFTGDSASVHDHVGMYVGNGEVIEAAGTQHGVIRSKITDKKWTWWGELKIVAYNAEPAPGPEPGYAVVTGKRVALRQDPSTSAKVITRIDTGKTVRLEDPPPCEWDYVSYQGKKGWMMKKFLKEGG